MTEPPNPAEATSAFNAALIAEVGKKTSICWIRYDGVDHPAWHIWLDDAMYVVSGGAEQPLPGISDVSHVEVVMRTKDSRERIVTWTGKTSDVYPSYDAWGPVTAALASERLNVPDLRTAAATWAQSSTVTRITPVGRMVESPGEVSSGSHQAVPLPTSATTRGPLPRVLHRRLKRRPKLS